MPGGEDWLMRPCASGMCLFESMKSGIVSLADIAFMNEILDVRAENERIAFERSRDK